MDPIPSPERLSPLDASFLYLERPTERLHVSAVAVLESSPPFAHLLATLEERLGRLRRYRQVPRRPLFDWHLPEWHDAPDFEVRRHVHRCVLAAPGDDAQLQATADPGLVPAIDRIPAALRAAEAELAESLGITPTHAAKPAAAMPAVADMMTRNVVTIAPDTRLGEIWTLMRSRRIRHLPVVDGAGCLRGLVTHRDVLAALPSSLGTDGQTATVLAFDWAEARDVMETHLSTATPDEHAQAAGRRMARQKIGCLPVVGKRGELVGIVTEDDFLRWATEHMAA